MKPRITISTTLRDEVRCSMAAIITGVTLTVKRAYTPKNRSSAASKGSRRGGWMMRGVSRVTA